MSQEKSDTVPSSKNASCMTDIILYINLKIVEPLPKAYGATSELFCLLHNEFLIDVMINMA